MHTTLIAWRILMHRFSQHPAKGNRLHFTTQAVAEQQSRGDKSCYEKTEEISNTVVESSGMTSRLNVVSLH